MKNKVIISIICLMIFFAIGEISYAAIQIVPSQNGLGTDAMVNTTISNSYLLCQNMKNEGESLYGSTVLPHLATNKDWGAVSYLSNSIYGTNTLGQANGVEVTIDGVKYYSTTTNITGVMNWGSNPNKKMFTHTSGITASYTASSPGNAIVEIYNNKDTRYVDIIGSNKGMAMTETNKWFNTEFWIAHYYNDRPVSVRVNLYGGAIAAYSNGLNLWETTGGGSDKVTFRPVIWNK